MKKLILTIGLIIASFVLLAQNDLGFTECLDIQGTEASYDVDHQFLRTVDDSLSADRYNLYSLVKCDWELWYTMFYTENTDVYEGEDGDYYITVNENDTIYRTRYTSGVSRPLFDIDLWDTVWVHKYVFDANMRPVFVKDEFFYSEFQYEDDVFTGIVDSNFTLFYDYDLQGKLETRTTTFQGDTTVFDYTYDDEVITISLENSRQIIEDLQDSLYIRYEELVGNLWLEMCNSFYEHCLITTIPPGIQFEEAENELYIDQLGREFTEPPKGFYIYKGKKYFTY